MTYTCMGIILDSAYSLVVCLFICLIFRCKTCEIKSPRAHSFTYVYLHMQINSERYEIGPCSEKSTKFLHHDKSAGYRNKSLSYRRVTACQRHITLEVK